MTRSPDHTIPIWPDGVPGALGQGLEDNPHLEIFTPEKPNGSALLICPGGGYSGRAPHEGPAIGEWLATLGITGVVCQYRVAPYQHPRASDDSRRGMKLIRHHANEWKIDPKRVGVMGFSAGGHLAATISTAFDSGKKSADPVDAQSSRPDVSVLCYPVITMTDPFAHAGSRQNLLGKKPTKAQLELLSAEKQVGKDTPPAFVFHTVEDDVVPVENALLYVEALRKNKVSCEAHLYESGPHGVGLATGEPFKDTLGTWPGLLANWLKEHGF